MHQSSSAVGRVALAFVVAAALASPAAADNGHPPLYSSQGGLTRLLPVDQLPDVDILAFDGSVQRLSQFRGSFLIVNFWATWCAACRDELPALDRLAEKTPDGELTVANVSIDEDGFSSVIPYIARIPIAHSRVFLDPAQQLGSRFVAGGAFGALPVLSLPMTYFVDRSGGVVGYISGAVDWDSPDSRRFVAHVLEQDGF